jgi:hypothetical protein
MWVQWGFRLADVRVRAHAWHGARDPHDDADTAAYAASIPGARRTVWPGGRRYDSFGAEPLPATAR